MSDDASPPTTSSGEQVYGAPEHALEAARRALASASATPAERADALWVLGRAAYYANHIHEAVGLLRDALQLTEEPEMVTEILLTLAPALSKEGHPEEALSMLEDPALGLSSQFAGQLRNQRGIILTELGRLTEALAEMEAALQLLRVAGDANREARTLVNLGAITSMMGHLDDAEQWYLLARAKTLATDQHVVAAGIEGNLGYVESRRGNFARALEWYTRARRSFDDFGDVDLLQAVLEVDHARTLLDVGLASDAAEAAGRALQSARSGGNQMLETQAQLLVAEALWHAGDHIGAITAVRRSRRLAKDLGQTPLELRAAYLAEELGTTDADADLRNVTSPVADLLAFGWVREAYDAALAEARRIRRADPYRAAQVLDTAGEWSRGLDVDPVNRALGDLLLSDIRNDRTGASTAFRQALAALAERRALLGSVEVRATITSRIRPVRDVAMAVALRDPSPADVVLDVLERTRAARDIRPVGEPITSTHTGELAELRDARVALAEAKLNGGDVEAATREVHRIERSILRRRRSAGTRPIATRQTAGKPDRRLPAGTAFVTFAIHDGSVLGLVRRDESTSLVPLGLFRAIEPHIRTQRAALRRLNDERRRDRSREVDRLASANRQLERRLLTRLRLEGVRKVVLTPAAPLRHVTWNTLRPFEQCALTLSPTLAAWNSADAELVVDRVVTLQGPNLASGQSEIDRIGSIWGRNHRSNGSASCAGALEALRHADLVHIAAHGTFRSDNPFFSSIEFADGPLSILEMSSLDRVPTMVVLSSCDAAAAASPNDDDEVLVGTATELRNLGVSVVIAPSIPVNDAAAAEFSVRLHRGLAEGASVDDAVLGARRWMRDSEDPRRRAAGSAFQVFGGRSTRRPVRRMNVA